MQKTRMMLHQDLCNVLGSPNCYYSPPSGIHMRYPAMVYQLADIDQFFADDIPYIKARRWTVTIIDKNPDSEIPDRLSDAFRYCSFDRFYTADNLNHFVFTIYY